MTAPVDGNRGYRALPCALVSILFSLMMLPSMALGNTHFCTRTAQAGTSPTCIVDPVKTDSRISKIIDQGKTQYHRVWLHHGRHARHLLVVFLAGSTDTTTDYDTFASQAAGDGFDVIVLAYPNQATINSYCRQLAKTGADKCWAGLRGEVSFGKNTPVPGIVPAPGYSGPKLDVKAPDSIVGRLVRVLDYLGAHDREPWRSYVHADPGSPYNGQLPTTRRIIIAGHSQGGGHAAFLAHHLRFHRVLTFSSPADYHVTNFTSACTPAAWLKTTSKTPIDRYYGFEDVHSFTFGCDKPGWDAMRYRGAPATANVDTTHISDLSDHRHELITRDDGHTYPKAAVDGCKRAAHSCVIADRVTPKTSAGLPIFGAVWRFMYGVTR